MKQKIALLLAGVLVGGLFMMLVPAAAHHQPGFRKLKNRVARLENKVNNRTQQLDGAGNYLGVVISEQVIALCEENSAALWEDSGFEFEGQPIVWIDDCFVEGVAASRRAVTEEQLQRVVGR